MNVPQPLVRACENLNAPEGFPPIHTATGVWHAGAETSEPLMPASSTRRGLF